ncbi:MAG: hypothetical protein MUF45_18660 [Spirosomaceae bacterium]|jgi:sensor histidine kinase regulating citrate/malate metabolism|nr:hypothetical protein [Spirosomataceae bacterium]
MEAVEKELSPEERQANIDALIEKIKASKKQIKEQIEKDRNNPEIQAIFKRLREENEKRFRKTA